MWSESELCFALLCGCFPVMPRLYQHLTSFTPYTTSAHQSNTYGRNAYNHTGVSSLEARNKVSGCGGTGMGSSKKGNWKALEEERGVPLNPLAKAGTSPGLILHQERSRDEVALEKGVQGKELNMGRSDGWETIRR